MKRAIEFDDYLEDRKRQRGLVTIRTTLGVLENDRMNGVWEIEEIGT